MIPLYLVPFASHLWQSTLFAAGVALLMLALRSNPARVRHALWLCASCKFLLPFSMLMAIGSQWHWPDFAPTATAIVHQATRLVMPDMFAPAPIAAASVAVAPSAGNWTPGLLFAIWLCGAATVLFRWAREWLRIRAIVRSAKLLSIDFPIGVRSTMTLLEPGVFGIVRPVLLLPEGIQDRLSAAEFAAVLAHELCHVRRRDNLTAMIQMLVEASFWFHPLVWWLSAKLVDERERACDEEVLREGSEPAAYAEGILKVCELYLESPAICMTGVTGSDLRKRITEIMRGSATRQIGWGKKTLLMLAGVAAIGVPVAIGMMDAPVLHAQSSAKSLSFEVASVKRNESSDHGIGFELTPGGRFTAKNVPLFIIVAEAYGVPFQGSGAQLSGGPDWIRAERFDIEAVAEKGSLAGVTTVKAREDRMRLMMQSLLADRFKLVVHRDTKELPVYAIVVSKGGPKIEKSKMEEKDCPDTQADGTNCHSFRGGMGRGLHAQAVTMEDLASAVSNWSDRPVVDRTGLQGLYKIETVGWAPMQPREGGDPGTAEDGVPWSERQTLFTIFEKMGLKLEAQRAPIERVVIESAQRPVEN
jgi:bla regulator protein BlaR1